MKSFSLPAGRYTIADACVTGDYYDEVILDEFIDWSSGDCGIINEDVFLYCTGSDGAATVRRTNEEKLGVVGIDAANISIVPSSRVVDHYGVTLQFDDEVVIKVYHDAIVVNDEYRIRV